MKEEAEVDMSRSRTLFPGLILACGAVLLSGCVLNEKYEAEKARSLNFQRLLAQEEKRTAELDNEVKRSKKELVEFETRNRELSAQVQAVREQMARVQEESEAIKEAALLERKAKTDMRRAAPPVSRPAPAVEPASTADLTGVAPMEAPADVPSAAGGEPAAIAPKGSGLPIHVVKPGETLYRISRRYGVKLETLRKWNKLPDDIIEVGQKLIVGQE